MCPVLTKRTPKIVKESSGFCYDNGNTGLLIRGKNFKVFQVFFSAPSKASSKPPVHPERSGVISFDVAGNSGQIMFFTFIVMTKRDFYLHILFGLSAERSSLVAVLCLYIFSVCYLLMYNKLA